MALNVVACLAAQSLARSLNHMNGDNVLGLVYEAQTNSGGYGYDALQLSDENKNRSNSTNATRPVQTDEPGSPDITQLLMDNIIFIAAGLGACILIIVVSCCVFRCIKKRKQ